MGEIKLKGYVTTYLLHQSSNYGLTRVSGMRPGSMVFEMGNEQHESELKNEMKFLNKWLTATCRLC